MSDLTAGYSFLLEFNQTALNKVVNAVFDAAPASIPTRFRHDEDGQPGLVGSRSSVSGRANFKRYLFEGFLGYELALHSPTVTLIPDARPQVRLVLGFDLTISRQLILYRTADALQIPNDPGSIDPDADYESVYDSSLQPTERPSVRGRISLLLDLADLSFGDSTHVSIDCMETDLSAVEWVQLEDTRWDEMFAGFVKTVGAKSISEVLRQEIRRIAITPLFGAFDAFGISLRAPLDACIGRTRSLPALAIGMHEWSLVRDGNRADIQFGTAGSDYALQIDEGFFQLLIAQLQNGAVLPRRFNGAGEPDESGDVLIHDARLAFEHGGIRLNLLAGYSGTGDLIAKTLVRFAFDSDGQVRFELSQTSLHVRLRGLLGAFLKIFNILTFYLVDSLVSEILGALFAASVNRPVGRTLTEFLQRGAVAFSFDSPVPGTQVVARLLPDAIEIQPGRAVLTGQLDIEPEGDPNT